MRLSRQVWSQAGPTTLAFLERTEEVENEMEKNLLIPWNRDLMITMLSELANDKWLARQWQTDGSDINDYLDFMDDSGLSDGPLEMVGVIFYTDEEAQLAHRLMTAIDELCKRDANDLRITNISRISKDLLELITAKDEQTQRIKYPLPEN